MRCYQSAAPWAQMASSHYKPAAGDTSTSSFEASDQMTRGSSDSYEQSLKGKRSYSQDKMGACSLKTERARPLLRRLCE